jgi:UDP-2-acetamido-2-deoxy-ribo-hexuluronate aminotransferase
LIDPDKYHFFSTKGISTKSERLGMNVVLDIDITLDLLLARDDEKNEVFKLLQAEDVNIWFPICAYLSLKDRLQEKSTAEIEYGTEHWNSFFDSIQLLSSLGEHYGALRHGSEDPASQLIALAAIELPGKIFIWTEAPKAYASQEELKAGSHHRINEFLSNNSDSFHFINLEAQQAVLRSRVEKGIFSVLRHGKYIMGQEVRELEAALGQFTGAKHVISCSNGTDALMMALMTKGIGPGDAVLTTPFTFIATAEVISLLGATPVFVDIDSRTFNLDPQRLQAAIVKIKEEGKLVPRGVIPVDLFGLPADYDAINSIAAAHDLFVLEDAAQGLGGVYKGRKAGTLAEVSTTSFFPAKPLGCYGDGGAIFTDDDDIAEKLISIRVHGKGMDKYDNLRIGLNGRLDTIQAAILLPKLSIFVDELKAREVVAEQYTKELCDYVTTPHVPKRLQSAWAQYSILSENREQIQSALKKNNIPSAVYYPIPLHLQAAYKGLDYRAGDFPVSERAAKQIFSLPMHPYLKEKEIKEITQTIRSFSLKNI